MASLMLQNIPPWSHFAWSLREVEATYTQNGRFRVVSLVAYQFLFFFTLVMPPINIKNHNYQGIVWGLLADGGNHEQPLRNENIPTMSTPPNPQISLKFTVK